MNTHFDNDRTYLILHFFTILHHIWIVKFKVYTDTIQHGLWKTIGNAYVILTKVKSKWNIIEKKIFDMNKLM